MKRNIIKEASLGGARVGDSWIGEGGEGELYKSSRIRGRQTGRLNKSMQTGHWVAVRNPRPNFPFEISRRGSQRLRDVCGGKPQEKEQEAGEAGHKLGRTTFHRIRKKGGNWE